VGMIGIGGGADMIGIGGGADMIGIGGGADMIGIGGGDADMIGVGGGAGMIGIGGGVDMPAVGGGDAGMDTGGRTVAELVRQQLTGGYSPFVGIFLGEGSMAAMANRDSYFPSEQWLYILREANAMNEPTRLKKLSFLKEMEEHHAAEGLEFYKEEQTIHTQREEILCTVKADQSVVMHNQKATSDATIEAVESQGRVDWEKVSVSMKDEYDKHVDALTKELAKKIEVLKKELQTKCTIECNTINEHIENVRKEENWVINRLECTQTADITHILNHSIDAIHKKRKRTSEIRIASADTLSRQQQALFNDS
jgi:hypothetical protein